MNLSDYLKILLKWKKFLIINFIFVLVVSFLVAFLLPKWYKSTASLKPAQKSDVSFMASLLSGAGLSSVGKSFNIGGLQYSDLDYFAYLLQSRSISMEMIEKFDLMNRYDKEYYFKTIEELNANTSFNLDPTSNTLSISVWDTEPEIAKEMVSVYLGLLSNMLDSLNALETKGTYEMMEQRFAKNKLDLENADNRLKEFQEKYNIVLPEDQFINTIKVISELEAQRLFLETQIQIIKSNQGEQAPTLESIKTQLRVINNKISEINRKDSTEDILVSYKLAPELINQYVKLYREIEIQSSLLEIMYPIIEEMRFNQSKNTLNFILIDNPNIPEYKDKPKRAVIILLGAFLGSFFSIAYVVMIESYKKVKDKLIA